MFGLSKIWLYAIVALIIVTAVGGFFAYQKSIVSDLRDTIAEKQKEITGLQEQVAGLIIDKEKLQASNNSLEGEIERRAAETKKVYADLVELQKSDAESQARITDLTQKLNDRERAEQLENIRNSRKAELLLRIINRNIDCEVQNFDKMGMGSCVGGKFRLSTPAGE